MGDGFDRVLAALKEAVIAELEGHHFYLMAARTTEDDAGRAVFEQLAQEEMDHARFLRAQYKSVLATGKGDEQVLLAREGALTPESPIFSPEIKERVAEAHFEMTALSVGIQLEEAAQQFYLDEAKAAEDIVVCTFFGELADWEATHAELLRRQQKALQEGYWTASGLIPA